MAYSWRGVEEVPFVEDASEMEAEEEDEEEEEEGVHLRDLPFLYQGLSFDAMERTFVEWKDVQANLWRYFPNYPVMRVAWHAFVNGHGHQANKARQALLLQPGAPLHDAVAPGVLQSSPMGVVRFLNMFSEQVRMTDAFVRGRHTLLQRSIHWACLRCTTLLGSAKVRKKERKELRELLLLISHRIQKLGHFVRDVRMALSHLIRLVNADGFQVVCASLMATLSSTSMWSPSVLDALLMSMNVLWYQLRRIQAKEVADDDMDVHVPLHKSFGVRRKASRPVNVISTAPAALREEEHVLRFFVPHGAFLRLKAVLCRRLWAPHVRPVAKEAFHRPNESALWEDTTGAQVMDVGLVPAVEGANHQCMHVVYLDDDQLSAYAFLCASRIDPSTPLWPDPELDAAAAFAWSSRETDGWPQWVAVACERPYAGDLFGEWTKVTLSNDVLRSDSALRSERLFPTYPVSAQAVGTILRGDVQGAKQVVESLLANEAVAADNVNTRVVLNLAERVAEQFLAPKLKASFLRSEWLGTADSEGVDVTATLDSHVAYEYLREGWDSGADLSGVGRSHASSFTCLPADGVLELRLRTRDPPKWLRALCQDESLLIPAPHFSHYACGLWLSAQDVTALPAKPSRWKFDGEGGIGALPPHTFDTACGWVEKKSRSKEAEERRRKKRKKKHAGQKKKVDKHSVAAWEARLLGSEKQVLSVGVDDEDAEQARILAKKKEKRKKKKRKKKKQQDVEVDLLFSPEEDELDSILRMRTVSHQDPKVYWANERTLLSWMHSVIFLAISAVSMVSYGQDMAKAAGVALIPLAIMFAVYAVLRFQIRLSAIVEGKEMELIKDRLGPYVLIPLIAVILATIVAFSFAYGPYK